MARLILIGLMLLGCIAATAADEQTSQNALANAADEQTSQGALDDDSLPKNETKGCIAADDDTPFCNEDTNTFPDTVCFIDACTTAIMNQIKEELDAAFKYMYLATHFAQVNINRPGIAKFLFEAATEERSHAILMLDYLNKRGVRGNFAPYSMDIPEEVKGYSLEYNDVLLTALKLEIQVTNKVYKVVKTCEEDYDAADIFTSQVLNEQHESMRKLQGAIRTLNDLSAGHTEHGVQLAVYMFDRKMLNGNF